MAETLPRVRVVVVDDEPLARAALRKLLSSDGEVELVRECSNGDEALEALRSLRPDVVFLDVQMPGRSGFEVLESLSEEERPAVVFTTAYDRYALNAFDLHAVDYLLKPFDDERFRLALTRAKDRSRTDAVLGAGRQLADLLAAVRGKTGQQPTDDLLAAPLTRLTIHREGRLEVVEADAVDWIEAADQYVCLHTAEGEHLMRESMSQLESQLDPARFMRVHRSAIVALDRVRRLETQGGGAGRVQLKDGTWVPVSRSRIANVRRQLG